jgi:hypothetical protein
MSGLPGRHATPTWITRRRLRLAYLDRDQALAALRASGRQA